MLVEELLPFYGKSEAPKQPFPLTEFLQF